MQMNWARTELGLDSNFLFIEIGKVRTFTFGLIHMIIIKYLFYKRSKTGKIPSLGSQVIQNVFLSKALQ